jgi:RNA-directed DNA polymerase
MRRKEKPVMKTGLEGIAVKAKNEPVLQFTSLAHHITKELIWENLSKMASNTAPGIDGVTVKEAAEKFPVWIDQMGSSIHRKCYKPPAVRRVWIEKPGKKEKRPLGVPSVADRALQKSVSVVLSAIYEQDFLKCSFGGRTKRSAHHALATFNEIIFAKEINYVLEADIKGFFNNLDHHWIIKLVQQRIGDPRILSLIQRWLKAGVMEQGMLEYNDRGTPQGSSISVLLSNIYLHYVLDSWFENDIKPRLKGEAYLIRYIDDFIICFQYKSDAERFYEVLPKRLKKFSLELEPNKTRLIKFGRAATKRNGKANTVYFLGFTHYCTYNWKGKFKLGRRTEKSRLKRSISKMQEVLRIIRHEPMREQVKVINQILRGHYAYYGIGGNRASLLKMYRATFKYWRKMLNSRSQKSYINWEKFEQLKLLFPILRPKLSIPYLELKKYVIL